MSDRPPREAPVSVRLPEELRNWIADQAAREERSFSAQIVWLLERGRELVAPTRDGALAEPGGAVPVAQGDEVPAGPTSSPSDSRVVAPGSVSADAEDRSVRGRTFEKPFQTDFKEPAKKKERRR